MKCEIIRDLLPLYHDGVCSAGSAEAVQEHLNTCPACRAVLEEMRRELPAPEPVRAEAEQEAKVLRGVRRRFSLRRRLSVLAVALAALAALALLTAASDEERPIPYHEGLVTARLAEDEAISIDFAGERYASFRAFSRGTAGGNALYFCYTQTIRSSVAPPPEDGGYICIGNRLMTDFVTASYQVPPPQAVTAVYYLEGSRKDYVSLPQMSDAAFAEAAQNAVLLWER